MIIAMICDVLGRDLSDLSDDSVAYSCMPPMRSKGKIPSAMTIMPAPPNQCNMARHSSIPRGWVDKSPITVAPMVVSPDIASKNASV